MVLDRGGHSRAGRQAGILTLFWHDWIEAVFGVDPDHGDGSAELWVVGVLIVVALAAGLAARRASDRRVPPAVALPDPRK